MNIEHAIDEAPNAAELVLFAIAAALTPEQRAHIMRTLSNFIRSDSIPEETKQQIRHSLRAVAGADQAYLREIAKGTPNG